MIARGIVGASALVAAIGCRSSNPAGDPPHSDRPAGAHDGSAEVPRDQIPSWLRPPTDAGAAPAPPPAAIGSAPPLLECFAAPDRYDVEGTAMPLVVADLDGNGRDDVLEYDSPWLGSDDGEYLVPYLGGLGSVGAGDRLKRGDRVKLGEMNLSFATADLDGDGKVDAVVTGYREKRLVVYPGKGDGTFGTPRMIPTARKPNGVVVADLTGDGKLDLVVTFFSHLQLFTGDGKLGFRAGPAIKTDQAPEGPIVGDLDGDGDVDVGTVGNDTNFFLTYVNDGHGRLAPGEHVEACASPAYPIGGDLDDDGDFDLGYMCDGGVELRLNDGHGAFTRQRIDAKRTSFVAAADINGDHHGDLVTFSSELDSSHVVLWLGDGTGHWTVRAEGDLDGQVQGIPVVADTDGDAHPDLVLGTWSGRPPGALVVLASRPCP